MYNFYENRKVAQIAICKALTVFQVPTPIVFAFKLLFAMIFEVVNTYINIGKHISSLCHTKTANLVPVYI